MTSTTSSPTVVVPEPRLRLAQAREPLRAMRAFEAAIELDPVLRELVRIRASQLNGCAFCLDMHLHDARERGERAQRLDTLAGWREAPFFSARERAALALTEAVTLLAERGVPDELWEDAERHFEADELARLVYAIAAINAWNRLAVTFRSTPASR